MRQRVVVVGGGISGLATAWELVKLNFDVTVLEATQRPGGRVLTTREGFLGGQYTEQGATLIPGNHDLTIGYAKEFNLPLQSFFDEDPATAYFFGGEKYVESSRNEHSYPSKWNLRGDENERGLDWIESDYFKRGFKQLGDPRAAGWSQQRGVKELDGMSFQEYLQKHGASETAIAIELAVEGSGGSKNSAAVWEAQAFFDQSTQKFFQIQGGNDRLPLAFAGKLEGKVLFGAAVVEIGREGRETKVRFSREGVLREIAADAVVFTLSPAILKKIRFSSGISSEKMAATRSVAMAPVTKVSLAMKKRFWAEEPGNSIFVAYTDTFVERVWDISVNQPGASGILIAYAQEDNAKALSELPEAEQIARSIETIEKFLPGSKSNFAKGSAYSWHQQSWVGGGWVSYVKNQLPVLEELGRKEGNFFFAGDHTSLRNAWMQGAFESAVRVVREVTGYFSVLGGT